jgi:hypothetical protein
MRVNIRESLVLQVDPVRQVILTLGFRLKLASTMFKYHDHLSLYHAQDAFHIQFSWDSKQADPILQVIPIPQVILAWGYT